MSKSKKKIKCPITKEKEKIRLTLQHQYNQRYYPEYKSRCVKFFICDTGNQYEQLDKYYAHFKRVFKIVSRSFYYNYRKDNEKWKQCCKENNYKNTVSQRHPILTKIIEKEFNTLINIGCINKSGNTPRRDICKSVLGAYGSRKRHRKNKKQKNPKRPLGWRKSVIPVTEGIKCNPNTMELEVLLSHKQIYNFKYSLLNHIMPIFKENLPLNLNSIGGNFVPIIDKNKKKQWIFVGKMKLPIHYKYSVSKTDPNQWMGTDFNFTNDNFVTWSIGNISGKITKPDNIQQVETAIKNLNDRIKCTQGPKSRLRHRMHKLHAIHEKLMLSIVLQILDICQQYKVGLIIDCVKPGCGTFGQDKLINHLITQCQNLGIPYCLQQPAYTSRQCIQCQHENEERGDTNLFICDKCGYTCDSHILGSKNLVNNAIIAMKEMAKLETEQKKLEDLLKTVKPIKSQTIKRKDVVKSTTKPTKELMDIGSIASPTI